jgi:hypothetical protein
LNKKRRRALAFSFFYSKSNFSTFIQKQNIYLQIKYQNYKNMVKEKVRYQTGTMTKSPKEMLPLELQKFEEKCNIDAKKYLFSIGQPLVYYIDNKLIIENSDGSIEYK